MEQISEQITESLIQELPQKTDFFTPQELLSSGVPALVVETLRKNVTSTLESGMNVPASDWVQTDSEKVLIAWNAFVEVAKMHARIPASKISYLLEEAVEQCLELALKPRQAVPEIIFKTRETIDLETAKIRVAEIEVNQQLGLGLLRYMEKKGKSELNIDQVRELVKKIDEKLVEDYHPLNWAQLLKPVFDIAGPSVNSGLFRIFFEDKEMPDVARKFDLLEKEINEQEFIEHMSSMELLDVDEFEDDEPQFFVSSEEAESETEQEFESAPWETEVTGFEAAEDEPTEEEPVEEQKDWDEAGEEKSPTAPEEAEESEEPEEEESEEEEEEPEEEESSQQEENIVGLFSQYKKEVNDDTDLFYLEKEEESSLSLVEPDDEPQEGGDDNVTLLNKFMFDESISEPDKMDEDKEIEEPTEDEIAEEAEDEFEEAAEEGEEDKTETLEKEPTSIYEEMNLIKENQNTTERMSEGFDEPSEEEEDETDSELSYNIGSEDKDEPHAETDVDEPDSLASAGQPKKSDEDGYEKDVEEKEDADDLPMWRSFLERDELETESGYEYENEDEEDSDEEFGEDEEGFIEEPIYDLTAEEPDPEEKLRDISKWLDDEKDWFVEEIFSHSEAAYEQALIEIVDFNDWKSASLYLEREVFSRNRIDVYDEAAVDFTDRLHSYFMENKS